MTTQDVLERTEGVTTRLPELRKSGGQEDAPVKVKTRRRKSTTQDANRIKALEGSVKDIAGLVESLGNSLNMVVGTITQLSEKIESGVPQRMNMTLNADQKAATMRELTGPDQMSQRSVSRDLLHPNAEKTGFQPDDVVQLREGHEHFHLFRVNEQGNALPPGTNGFPARGMILKYMYTKKNGQRKYKVDFPGFGKTGATEGELTLVRP